MHSDAQQKAICHVTGPALVLAGPGSGKTRVITERIKYLTNNRGISPENILVVTFTKAAATEMKQRYMQGNNKQGIVFGTFHSIFFFILKHAYRYTAKDILTEGEKRRFIQAYLQTNHIENENETDLIGDVIAELSKVKSERYDMEAYFSTSCGNDEFRGIVHSYQEFLRQNRKLDFDDMMIYTYDLFCARPDILHLWQDKFQYILIDEFQDINALQYDIIQLLAQPKNNLFIVGDDDQSIYSFRGSKPSYMLQFEEKYKNAVRIV